MLNFKDIYNRIVTLSKENSLTGVALGQKLGLKKSPLTDWKNGKSTPTLEQIATICEIFAVSSDYIIFGKDSINSNNYNFNDADIKLIKTIRSLPIHDQNRIEGMVDIKHQEFIDNQKSSTSLNGNQKTTNKYA